jgi:hypothetical protein
MHVASHMYIIQINNKTVMENNLSGKSQTLNI